MADGAASVEVAADADPAENQDPEADGGPDDNVSLAPTDPEAPPISVGCAQSIEPTEAEKIAQVGATQAACVDAAAGVRGRSRDHPHRRRQRMPSMKRSAAVFARAADITLKTSSIGGNVVPNVKLMDSQREPNACDAILQAVVQRSQLIPEVVDTINETWTKFRGE